MASANYVSDRGAETEAPLLSRFEVEDSETFDFVTQYSKQDCLSQCKWPIRSNLGFFTLAILLGVGFHMFVWGMTASRSDTLTSNPQFCVPNHSQIIPMAQNATKEEAEQEKWTLEKARDMVARTRGYYVRDYSLQLGWNNMRYIIEAALLHADLLNRTLVVPSYIYARACEFEIHVCAAFTTMINRNAAFGFGEWSSLPVDEQMGFKVPIGIMLDLVHLRKRHSVVTLEEYLLLHNLSPSLEHSNGFWYFSDYHNANPRISLHVIPNGDFDPPHVVRVDQLSLVGIQGNASSEISTMLHQRLGDGRPAMPMADARGVLANQMNLTGLDVQAVLEENGWTLMYTFRGTYADWTKTVVDHMQEVAPRTQMRGLVDDYSSVEAEVLLLQGEVHVLRKPGSLLFTRTPPRDDFARTVLFDMRPIEAFRSLALKLHSRLESRVGGRMWMGAHMRRKDFINYGWTHEPTIKAHLRKVKQRLAEGRSTLERLHREHKFLTHKVPGVKPEHEVFDRDPPEEDDLFYLATDARTEANKTYLRNNGAILIDDLLTLEDRQAFGWPIMLTDVLAVLEQTVLSHSAFFVGSQYSSFTGGVVNMRAALGADSRTLFLD